VTKTASTPPTNNHPIGLEHSHESAPADPRASDRPDGTLLFKYSALGFNSHRIDLDRCFCALAAEGFPRLVANGGLATDLIAELLRTELNANFNAYKAKQMAPLFCGRPILLIGKTGSGCCGHSTSMADWLWISKSMSENTGGLPRVR
jgi:hydroxyacyl-ACP dehydratase HTD2-like protein with hotdog domain